MKKENKENKEKPSPAVVETSKDALDFFKSLTAEEQDQILRHLVAENGFGKILNVLQSSDTPGALDLFLDRVRYYHFLRVVKE